MIRAYAFRAAAALLQGLAIPFLVVGYVATPLLDMAAWCIERAREWDPRLWDRDHDPRSDERRWP